MKEFKTSKTPPKKRGYHKQKKSPDEPAKTNSKLTDKVQEKICGFIAGGMRWEDACVLSGIHRSTAWVWKDRGAAGEERYKEFLEAVELAEMRSKALLVADIRRDVDWKAKKWLLMNRFPKEFRDSYTQEVVGADGGPVSLSLNPFTVNVNLTGIEQEFTTINEESKA